MKKYEMSESLITMSFLTFSGGLQDAYSYYVRGGVFANAQTGNIVLMCSNFFNSKFMVGLKYLLPIISFLLGVFIVEKLENKYKNNSKLHWRQIVLLIEIINLFIVGFIPSSLNILANSIVSFSCAMQVEAFRKVNGFNFASTMCIGNMRSGMEAFSKFSRTKKKSDFSKTFHYFTIIFIFGIGAGIGSLLVNTLKIKLIWLSCIMLLVGFIFMFKKTP